MQPGIILCFPQFVEIWMMHAATAGPWFKNATGQNHAQPYTRHSTWWELTEHAKRLLQLIGTKYVKSNWGWKMNKHQRQILLSFCWKIHNFPPKKNRERQATHSQITEAHWSKLPDPTRSHVLSPPCCGSQLWAKRKHLSYGNQRTGWLGMKA